MAKMPLRYFFCCWSRLIFIPYTEFYSFDILWNDYGFQNTNYVNSAWIIPVDPNQNGHSVFVGKISASKIWFLGVSNYEDYGEGEIDFSTDIPGHSGSISFQKEVQILHLLFGFLTFYIIRENIKYQSW